MFSYLLTVLHMRERSWPCHIGAKVPVISDSDRVRDEEEM